jgi:hypothetical protein
VGQDRWRARAATTLEWIADQGIVLQSARGPVPNVAQFIAGEPIPGSWWGHRAGKEIYAVLSLLDESPDLVSTRLINHKITLVHARVWPSVVRASELLGVSRLAAIHTEHTAGGAHRSFDVDYPQWVTAATLLAADGLSLDEALANLPACLRDTTR